MTPPAALSRWGALDELDRALAAGPVCVEAHGLWGSARALTIAALALAGRRPALAVAPGPAQAHATGLDLAFFTASLAAAGAPPVLEFPPAQPAAWRRGRKTEHDAERALVCHQILSGVPAIVIATPAALSAPLLPPAEFRARAFRVGLGDTFTREDLAERLAAAGYERVESVVEVGQWSARGGIVDVFSPARERPVRAEFLGDEIESLRVFDPTTQRSIDETDEFDVLPLASLDAESTLVAYLPAETLVALDEATELEAPSEDAPA